MILEYNLETMIVKYYLEDTQKNRILLNERKIEPEEVPLIKVTRKELSDRDRLLQDWLDTERELDGKYHS